MKACKISLDKSEEVAFAFGSFRFDVEPNTSDLSEKELKICSQFKSLKRRCEYTFGRRACRIALHELNADCKNILNDASGAPFMENSDFIPTISHSQGKIVVLIYKKNFSFGVDIERINPKKRSILEKLYSEYKTLGELTALWSLQESIAKAARTGVEGELGTYETENFINEFGFCKCNFKNFKEYYGIAVYNEKWATSLVCKKEYELDKEKLRNLMQEWIS